MGGAGVLVAMAMLGASVAPSGGEPEATQAIAQEAAPLPTASARWPVRVGVQLDMASVPRPLGVELYASMLGLLDLGAGYSVMPRALGDIVLSAASVDDAWFNSWAVEGVMRVHPFRGPFFLGWSLGRQSLTASATRQGYTGVVDVTTLYLTPRLGWMGILDSGITLAVDLGVQVPLSVDSTATSAPPPAASEVRNIGHAAGEILLPSLNFRVGYAL